MCDQWSVAAAGKIQPRRRLYTRHSCELSGALRKAAGRLKARFVVTRARPVGHPHFFKEEENMTPQQIVGLAVRIFSIWLIVGAFQTFGIASAMNAQSNHPGATAVYLIVLLPLLLAAFLWLFPMLIAHKLVPRTHDTNTLRMPAREAAAAASAIIGLWLLISVIPQLVANFSVAVFLGGGARGVFANFAEDRLYQLVVAIAQCVFGVFLVMKPWFVAGKVFPGGDSFDAKRGASVEHP